GHQGGDVAGPADGIADRVEVELQILDTGAADEPVGELDYLGVDRRPRIADRLHVPLPELSVAAGLWSVVAEHGAESRESHRLRERLHPMLDIRAGHARCCLRTQCPALLVRPRR